MDQPRPSTPVPSAAFVKPRHLGDGAVAYRVHWCDPGQLDQNGDPKAASVTFDEPEVAERLAALLNANNQRIAAVEFVDGVPVERNTAGGVR